MVGRLGGSSAGFVVAALNAASAVSREVVVLRVLSAGILCPLASTFLTRARRETKAGDMSALRHETGIRLPYVDVSVSARSGTKTIECENSSRENIRDRVMALQ